MRWKVIKYFVFAKKMYIHLISEMFSLKLLEVIERISLKVKLNMNVKNCTCNKMIIYTRTRESMVDKMGRH